MKGAGQTPFQMTALRNVMQNIYLYSFGAALLGGAFITYRAVAAANPSLPIALGSLTAAIGLVTNISFNYNRTVEDKDQADELNRRSGKLLLAVINLVYAVMLSVISLALPREPQGMWQDLLTTLQQWALPLFVGVLVLVSGMSAVFHLVFFERFITTRFEQEFELSKCQSKVERWFLHLVALTDRK